MRYPLHIADIITESLGGGIFVPAADTAVAGSRTEIVPPSCQLAPTPMQGTKAKVAHGRLFPVPGPLLVPPGAEHSRNLSYISMP